MKKTFVTFLGRGRENTETGYRETTYQFPDNSQETTAFFGFALAEYIGPNRTIILGTRSSQWGILVEHLADAGGKEDARLELMDAETRGEVEQRHLDAVTDLMCSAVNYEIIARLIPFGKNEDEQYKILDVIADNVLEGNIDFDLTHGFRHFGMIGFLSAFMLARVRGLNVNNLWYGALDMTQNNITPVLKLDGLNRVRQWLDALNRFDATGDYRIFGSLLTKDGVAPQETKHLENAAFHERTFNLPAAAAEIRKFKPALKTDLTGASRLFQQKLADRLRWADWDSLSEQQAELARQYLGRRDYVRAALFAWETLVTLACKKNGLDPEVISVRMQQSVLSELSKLADEKRQAGKILNQIRNALAHGNQSQEIQEIFADEQNLRAALQNAFECLFPKPTRSGKTGRNQETKD